MKYLLPFLLACTEVSINKIPEVPKDTSVPIVDTTEPASEPSIEPSTEPPDGIGGYVHYYLRQVACPPCVGAPREISVELTAHFHEPVEDSYTNWVMPQGECTEAFSSAVPNVPFINLGQTIKIKSGSTHFEIYHNSYNIYTMLFNDDSQYIRDSVHEITREDEYNFASFTSFHGFDYIEPYELRYIDPSYAFAAPIYRSGATFWWGPSGTNTTFMITLAVYTPDGSSLLGYVACTGPDNGMMTIPGQYLAGYPYWALVAVHMARHKIELVPWEEQNTFLETHMEWEVVGTGHIE